MAPEALANQGRLLSQEGLTGREEKCSTGTCAIASKSGAAGFGAPCANRGYYLIKQNKEYVTETMYGPRSLKYVCPGTSRKKFADP